MSSFFSKLLKHFNISNEEYSLITREPSFSSIPTLNKDNENVLKAKERIFDAIRTHQKILIYGDYDCDGIMSTSILAKAITKLGGEPATYVPSRYIDGYGISVENANKIISSGYKLVITVDNGVTAFLPLELLQNNHIDVIIIDHHEIGEKLPLCYAIIHPDLLKYGPYGISAGYLCFLFSCVLLNEADNYLLTLGAVSTLSDMMPLHSYNREIVRLGLNNLRKHHYLSFDYLFDKQSIDCSSLSMQVIPSINSIGRIVEDTSINRLIPYFTEENELKIYKLSMWMKDINVNRKELTKRAFDSLIINKEDYGIVARSSLPEGLNGLLANMVISKEKKPVVILSPSKKDPSLLIGSARSLTGMSLMDCYNELNMYLESSGGHDLAAGLSIKESNFDDFKKAFNKYCFNHLISSEEKEDVVITSDEINLDNYYLLQSFSPFGTGWKEPQFLLENVSTANLQYVKDGKYLCTKISNEAKLLSFTLSKEIASNYSFVNLSGKFKLNVWKNTENVDFICDLSNNDVK